MAKVVMTDTPLHVSKTRAGAATATPSRPGISDAMMSSYPGRTPERFQADGLALARAVKQGANFNILEHVRRPGIRAQPERALTADKGDVRIAAHPFTLHQASCRDHVGGDRHHTMERVWVRHGDLAGAAQTAHAEHHLTL